MDCGNNCMAVAGLACSVVRLGEDVIIQMGYLCLMIPCRLQCIRYPGTRTCLNSYSAAGLSLFLFTQLPSFLLHQTCNASSLQRCFCVFLLQLEYHLRLSSPTHKKNNKSRCDVEARTHVDASPSV